MHNFGKIALQEGRLELEYNEDGHKKSKVFTLREMSCHDQLSAYVGQYKSFQQAAVDEVKSNRQQDKAFDKYKSMTVRDKHECMFVHWILQRSDCNVDLEWVLAHLTPRAREAIIQAQNQLNGMLVAEGNALGLHKEAAKQMGLKQEYQALKEEISQMKASFKQIADLEKKAKKSKKKPATL